VLSFYRVFFMRSYLSTKYMKFKICKNLTFINASSTNKQLGQYSHVILKGNFYKWTTNLTHFYGILGKKKSLRKTCQLSVTRDDRIPFTASDAICLRPLPVLVSLLWLCLRNVFFFFVQVSTRTFHTFVLCPVRATFPACLNRPYFLRLNDIYILV